MQDPRKLLKDIVELIEADIKEIKKASEIGKLDHFMVLDLTKYSKALLEISEDKDLVVKEQKKSLSKLSNEELQQLAIKVLGETPKIKDPDGKNE